MSTLEKLRNLNLSPETMVRLTYSSGADVFHFNETEIETALSETDVVSTLAELVATPKLSVQTQYGNNILEEIRDQGLLEDYERDGGFEDYLSETITYNFYDLDVIEYSTQKYDHKRGFTTLTADVNVALGDLMENAFWVSSAWEVSVPTENGTLTLD